MMSSDRISAERELPGIAIAASDYDRLTGLAAGSMTPQVGEYLERELGRARIVPDAEFEADVVRVGSEVTYSEDQGGRLRSVTLVWPSQADMQSNRISVLTSIGVALLGMRAGQTIDWPAPLGGARTLTVQQVRNPQGSAAQA